MANYVFSQYALIGRIVTEAHKIAHKTAQKMQFSITDFCSKSDQIRRKLRIWSHLLKKSVTENFSFYVVQLSRLIFDDKLTTSM